MVGPCPPPSEYSPYPDMEPQILVPEDGPGTSPLEVLDESGIALSDPQRSKCLSSDLVERCGNGSTSVRRIPQSGSGKIHKPQDRSKHHTVEKLEETRPHLEPQECSKGPPSDCDSDEVDLLKVMKRRDEPPDPEVLQEDLSATDEDEDDFTVHFAHTGRKTCE